MLISYSQLTHKGGRENNEDSVLSLENNGFYLFALADGMGGRVGGEVASGIAVEVLSDLFHRIDLNRDIEIQDFLLRSLGTINRKIMERSVKEPHLLGMGTTITVLLLSPATGSGKENVTGTIANIGDSRTYVLRNSLLRQITKDHSAVQELFDSGEISRAEMWKHPKRNVITRSLGSRSDVPYDDVMYRLVGQPGDRFLLSSDGLTDYVEHEVIQRILSSIPPGKPDQACSRLFKEAMHAPTQDNISIIVVDLKNNVRIE